jgi:glyoxylase-like metal-dependent hydrolase (beta-lactamase superfamily II)
MNAKMLPLAFVVVAACTIADVARAQDAAPLDAEIRQILGDLYEVRAGGQIAVFLVTPQGIILGDPLNRPTAVWLRGELSSRFPNRPVRYVVHSHHHFDRAEDGGVFDTAQVVAHREFNSEVAAARSSLPAFVAVTDSNLNGRFDPSEIAGSSDAALILSRDRNGDGIVTATELYSQVRPARITYSKRLTIMLGGKSVELVHPGPAYARDMTVLYFPEQRVVFAADAPPVTTAPFSFGPFRPRDVYEWIHAIAPLDFDMLIFGNGETLARADLVGLAAYLDAMRSKVADASEQGTSLAEAQARVVLDQYRASPHYAGRSTQIAAVYRTVQLLKLEVSAVGVSNYDRPDSSHCASYTLCAVGGAVPAATGAAAFLFGKGFGVAGELTLGQQSWNTRTRPLYQEEIALRQSRGSVLFRFAPPRSSRLSYAFLGGASTTVGDARGMTHLLGAFVPAGGRHNVHSNELRIGYTAGVDVLLDGRFGLVVPVRATYTPSLPQYWPSRVNIRAGIGMSLRLLRHVG